MSVAVRPPEVAETSGGMSFHCQRATAGAGDTLDRLHSNNVFYCD